MARRRVADAQVAPRAGAWIETQPRCRCTAMRRGRPPCGGVDRNARGVATSVADRASPPVRGRGSKHSRAHRRAMVPAVAPRAGAWIETRAIAQRCAVAGDVAPRAGAWIETPCGAHAVALRMTVAPRAGAWIETSWPRKRRIDGRARRPPCGGVDRNDAVRIATLRRRPSPPVRGRGSKPVPADARSSAWSPPCGGVDRNIPLQHRPRNRSASPPVRGRGLKPSGAQ